jgi:hypothetical protein
MLSSCLENPKKLHVKGSSLKDFQPPVVLIKQRLFIFCLSRMPIVGCEMSANNQCQVIYFTDA